MAFTGFLVIGTVVATVAAFVLALRRTSFPRALVLAALVFLGAAGASIATVGVVVGGMSS